MTVLEFGAGSCWLSRILTQLQCQAIACDVSSTALKIGRELFVRLPPLGNFWQPKFLLFDGSRIDLPNQSVDRVICNDAFHHVPNEATVLHEFARILKPGGIAGFSEPGKHHSQKLQSQLEMKNFGVLERDIDLPKLFTTAREAGFTHITHKIAFGMELSLEQHRALLAEDPPAGSERSHRRAVLRDEILAQTRASAEDKSLFFLYKGDPCYDSRQHAGLKHSLTVTPKTFRLRAGESQDFKASLTNTGAARWLISNLGNIGVVRLGTHLYDHDRRLLAFDFSRHNLPAEILAGERTEIGGSLTFDKPGKYIVAFDLVAEGISWFETLGSAPQEVPVTVE
jgi:SAM-dependent methyltransferase